MGLWISPCVCLLLSSLPALAVGAQERLPLVNAGFEDDRTGWYPRIESAGPDAISIDREVFHSGAASLRIRQERSSSYSNVVQALDVQRYGNYLARCYVRAEDVVRAGIGINLFIGDIRGMGIGGFVNEEDREGTFEWRQVTVPFNSGKHERITVIPYLHESTGTVWFDDIEVVPIDAGWRPPTGAVTADYTQPPSLPREEQFNWDTVSTEVVTTSTAWATQLASGPLKALVIAPAWSQRESVELAQRCDVEVTPLMTLNRGLLGHGSNQWGMLQIEEARRLAEAKAEGEYDVIVVGKQKWVSLPSNVREKLLVEVRAGCGLVWVLGPGDELPPEIRDAVVPAPEIAAALPLTSLPAFEEHASDTQAAEAIARAGQVGKGRVVVLDYGEDALAGHHYLTPATYAAADGSWTHYEYYQALLIRAVLEAAPAPTEARITPIRCPPIQGGRGSLEAQIECPRNTTAAFTVQVRAASGGYVDV
ncbi:MAG TPA: hypothetical protein QGH10_20935, partial [Armatimonadota bacterium]|nr:hypothetical protein [Armatimonadota bacterium]